MLSRDDASVHETQNFLGRVYKGSVSLMLSALTKKQALTQKRRSTSSVRSCTGSRRKTKPSTRPRRQCLLTRAVWNCKNILYADKLVFERGVRVSHAYIVASMSEETRREAALAWPRRCCASPEGDRPAESAGTAARFFRHTPGRCQHRPPAWTTRAARGGEILVDQVRFVSADAQVMPNEAGVRSMSSTTRTS